MHAASPLRRGKTQLLDEQRQIDAEPLGSLDLASGARMSQPLFGSHKLLGRQVAPLLHTLLS